MDQIKQVLDSDEGTSEPDNNHDLDDGEDG
jgi:hypothetical protein